MNSKFIFAILWGALILVATCTTDAYVFLFDQIIHFQFEPRPALSELFIVNDIDFRDNFYLLQKTGHFISFGILYVLVLNWLRKRQQAFMVCAFFAVFTEILQLYFQRDGRLFDVLIDLLGVYFAFTICNFIRNFIRTATSS